MINDFIKLLSSSLNVFDFFVSLIFFYTVIQCFIKGFSLSLISFMKWVISTVVTIILVPKLQPVVGEYIESQFLNSFGVGILVFVFTLFVTSLI